MQKILHYLLIFLSFLLAIAVSIKNLREPDIWWQIRTGEWIIKNGKVPSTDIFSFTHYGKDWINIKWGFEVLAAFISTHFGPEAVFLIQISISILLLWFVYKTLKLFNLHSAPLFLFTTIILLFSIEYRIIGRPEMFSHVLLVIYIYLLLLYNQTKTKLIFFVVPLQIIWCNMHEAYAIGLVVLLIYTLVSWLKYFFQNTEKPMVMSGITLLSICAILVNPRGILLLTRPFNIFSQVQQNKYTTELDSIFSSDFWHKESYFFMVVALLFAFYVLRLIKQKKSIFVDSIFPLEYIAICMAFLFLSFTAYRNIVFFQLSVFPLVAFALQAKFKKLEQYKWPLAIVGIGIYASIVSNKYYQWVQSRDRFGLEVLSINNPVGAANFIEQKNLKAKKCFSDYLTSSYLLWKLQPDFKTYIDLRDLDIFNTAFFEQYLEIINNPQKFHELDQKENFEYVVLYRRSNEALHQYLFNDSIYACTFVDAVAAVYQKTDSIPSGDFFQANTAVQSSKFSEAINTIFNPNYSPFQYELYNNDLEAATYYTTVGKISLAEKRINQFLYANPNNEDAINLKNQIFNLKSKRIK